MIANIRETTMPGVCRFLVLAMMSCLITPAARSQVEAADAEFTVGISANDKGDVKGALDHLQRAVALDPKMIKAHFAIGAIAELGCYSSEGDAQCKLALEEYKNVLELDASRYDVLKNIAYASYVLDQINQSETYYRKAPRSGSA